MWLKRATFTVGKLKQKPDDKDEKDFEKFVRDWQSLNDQQQEQFVGIQSRLPGDISRGLRPWKIFPASNLRNWFVGSYWKLFPGGDGAGSARARPFALAGPRSKRRIVISSIFSTR